MSTQYSARRLSRRKRLGSVAGWTLWSVMALGMFALGVAMLLWGVQRIEALGSTAVTESLGVEWVHNILILLLAATLILGTPAAYVMSARDASSRD